MPEQVWYSPDTDAITLPPFAAFFTPVDYYSTRAHETGHWSSRADRCNRELGKRFGDNANSVEELIAELTAAFTIRAKNVRISYLSSTTRIRGAFLNGRPPFPQPGQSSQIAN